MERKSFHMAIFGESTIATPGIGLRIASLDELEKCIGKASEGEGLTLAIQALLYEYTLTFFPVKEEGYSLGDYHMGFECLRDQRCMQDLGALAIPGMSHPEIIDASQEICRERKSILLMGESDFFDYMTATDL